MRRRYDLDLDEWSIVEGDKVFGICVSLCASMQDMYTLIFLVFTRQEAV